jgi:O-antigen ligase
MACTVVLAMLTLTVLGPWMTYKPEPYTGEGSPLRQLCYFAVFPLAIVAVRPLQKPGRLIAMPLLLIGALLWCWASVRWAIAPDMALRRLLLTTIVIWTIFLAVEELGYAQTMRLIRVALVVTLVANFLTVLIFPNFGIHQLEVSVNRSGVDPGLVGDWRGMMLQKNFAGAACAFTLLTFALDARRIRMWLRVLVISASVLFLIKSGSKTSMGLSLLGLGLGWAYMRYNPAYRLLLIPLTLTIGAGAYLFVVTHWDMLIAPLYNQAAFTGRTQIWPPLLAFANDHLTFGAGYGSFWNIGPGKSPIYAYSKGWVVHITQGHDGYLDLLVTIGLPGLLLVVVATIVAPIVRLLAHQSIPRSTGALLLAIVVFCAGHNFTESSLFDRDAIVQTFLMFAVALIYKVAPPARSWRSFAGFRKSQRRVFA